MCGMTFPSLCLTPECYVGLKEQSIFGCFLEFVFQFSVVQVLVGLHKQFLNNFVFITWACDAKGKVFYGQEPLTQWRIYYNCTTECGINYQLK